MIRKLDLGIHKMYEAATNSIPLVSIVTPAYNAMPFIVKTIKSIEQQDYPRIEHIVVDGGSNDGTLEVLANNSKIKWLSESDRGQSNALNKGFRLAQGEIIGWLNADDTYVKDAISKAVNFLLENPEIDIVYTDVNVIDENDQFLRLAKGEPFSLERLIVNNIVKQPTVFMRRKVFDLLGGVKENLHYVMDHEYWLRAGFCFNLHYLREDVFANFRFCNGTKSYEHTPEFYQEWISVLEEMENENQNAPEIRNSINKAKQTTIRSKYFSLMVQYSERGSRLGIFQYLIKSFLIDKQCLLDVSTWKLLFRLLYNCK